MKEYYYYEKAKAHGEEEKRGERVLRSNTFYTRDEVKAKGRKEEREGRQGPTTERRESDQ